MISRIQHCICVGPTGSGKTLLLKKLQNIEVDETSTSIPTVGTNIFSIKSDILIEIHELGGGIAPLWSKYYDFAAKVIYVVDASNLCQISAAGVLLYSLLVDPKCASSKVLLALTKMDVSYRQMRNEALLMLQIDRLKTQIKQSITIIEVSALTGEGISKVLDWLKN